MNTGCVLPEQTASFSVCLNDDIIMEGVPVITNTKSCNYDSEKVQQVIQKNEVIIDNQVLTNFDDYYKLLLEK